MNFYWELSQRLFGLAVLFQAIEWWQLRKELSPGGIWSSLSFYKTCVEKYGHPSFFARILADHRLFILNLLTHFFSSLVIVIHPQMGIPYLLTALTSFIFALRFYGTFNGASDSMTFLLSLSHFIYFLSTSMPINDWADIFLKISYLIILVQVTSSYFISGISKARQKSWWTGLALQGFLQRSFMNWVHEFMDSKYGSYLTRPAFVFASYLVLAFELLFPVAFIFPNSLPYFLGFGVIFHMLNSIVFGLSRFFWLWISTYPIFIWCVFTL